MALRSTRCRLPRPRWATAATSDDDRAATGRSRRNGRPARRLNGHSGGAQTASPTPVPEVGLVRVAAPPVLARTVPPTERCAPTCPPRSSSSSSRCRCRWHRAGLRCADHGRARRRVVGGVVAGLLGGSPLQVSGPAAGLTVVVAELVDAVRLAGHLRDHGRRRPAADPLRLSPGSRRFAAADPARGRARHARRHRHHDRAGAAARRARRAARARALAERAALPAQLAGLHPAALAVGVVTIALVVAWPRLRRAAACVPGPLVAVVAATLLAWLAAGAAGRPAGRAARRHRASRCCRTATGRRSPAACSPSR